VITDDGGQLHPLHPGDVFVFKREVGRAVGQVGQGTCVELVNDSEGNAPVMVARSPSNVIGEPAVSSLSGGSPVQGGKRVRSFDFAVEFAGVSVRAIRDNVGYRSHSDFALVCSFKNEAGCHNLSLPGVGCI